MAQAGFNPIRVRLKLSLLLGSAAWGYVLQPHTGPSETSPR